MTDDPFVVNQYRRQATDVGDAGKTTVEESPATLSKGSGQSTPALSGLLADYFTDREDVRRFVEEERSAWEE